ARFPYDGANRQQTQARLGYLLKRLPQVVGKESTGDFAEGAEAGNALSAVSASSAVDYLALWTAAHR
ncbi:MAG TPA: hypothetical protein VFV87_21465, partial [Pirellulaceae bacterium]|nr:hypothetical protein [Pirellulaceae bacterium]